MKPDLDAFLQLPKATWCGAQCGSLFFNAGLSMFRLRLRGVVKRTTSSGAFLSLRPLNVDGSEIHLAVQCIWCICCTGVGNEGNDFRETLSLSAKKRTHCSMKIAAF